MTKSRRWRAEAGVAGVAESGRLADQCADEVGAAYRSFAAGNSHGLAALERLCPTGGGEGRTSGGSPAEAGTLADAIGQEDIDRGVAPDPPMLETLGRDAS